MHGPDAAYYRRVQDWSSTPSYRAELDAFCEHFGMGRGDQVLDVGCGPGASMRGLAHRGARCTGVDVSPAWPPWCTERPVVRADAAALPFADASFDGALLMHVVAHLVRPGATLRELHRVLRPGARLGIVTPNVRYVRVVGAVPRWWNGYEPDWTVERHLDLDEVVHLVERSGFEVHRAVPWGKIPRLFPLTTCAERLFVVAHRSG